MTRNPAPAPGTHDHAGPLDLSRVSQRILKLAEIAVLDHLESIARSQAVGIAHWHCDTRHAGIPPAADAPNFTN